MKRNLYLWSLGMLLMLSSGLIAQTTQATTLHESLEAAAKNSARLRASYEQVVAARASAKDAGAARLPRLDLNGGYNYTSVVPQLKIALPVQGVPPITRDLGDGNVYDFNVTAKAPIFSGGALVERERAEQASLQASEQDLASDSLRLAYDVRRAYFNALGAAKREETARQSSARLERHLKELQGAKDAGMASDEMIIQTESRLRQAEGAVLNAEADSRSARMQLANLVGRPGDEVFPAEELEASLSPGDPLPKESRNDVAAINDRISQSRHLTRASQGGFLPTLSAQAAYHYAKPGVDQFKNDWMNYGTLGLNLTWTLWDWNSRSARVAQAKAGLQNLQARKDDLVNAIDTRLASAKENAEASRAALDKASQRVELERRRFDLVQGRYRVGSTSESEYLDAQDDLTSAELDRSAAAVKLRLAETEWLNAEGR